jgi:hypothetical protein
LSPQAAANFLQIAVNCISPDAAVATLDSLSYSKPQVQFSPTEAVDATAVRRILITAAMRQHEQVFDWMAGFEHHVDPPTLEAVLTYMMSSHEDVCVWLLGTWRTAADSLSGDAMARLILAALEHGLDCQREGCLAAELTWTAAALQLSPDAVADIIQASIEQYSSYLVACACDLPAAQQLSNEVAKQLLQAALQQRDSDCTSVLCTLPAAQQLSSRELADLLQVAVQQGRVRERAAAEMNAWCV